MAARKKSTRRRGGATPGKAQKGQEQKYRAFLTAYRRLGNLKVCADLVGVSINSVRDKAAADPSGFGMRFSKAKSELIKKLVDGQVTAATTPDAHGRIDTKAGQFMLTNLDPANYKHRREDITFDGGAYESGIQQARQSLTPEERKELQELGKKRILQRGTTEG